MEGLIRVLFVAIGILYLVRAIFRWLIPTLFQSVVNKAQQQYNQTNYQQGRPQQKPAGRITVDYVPEKKEKGSSKKFSDNAGEFVDYEEVK